MEMKKRARRKQGGERERGGRRESERKHAINK
jgi:hypothetical protein